MVLTPVTTDSRVLPLLVQVLSLLAILVLLVADAAGFPPAGNRVDKEVGYVHFTFRNDDVEWDPKLGKPRVVPYDQRPSVPDVTLEVRRIALPGSPNPHVTMRGLFVKKGEFKAGHLVGCYTGAFVTTEDAQSKKKYYPSTTAYGFAYNDTHQIDPTDDQGQMPEKLAQYRKDQEGGVRSKMPLTNEPWGETTLPNVVAAEVDWCKDKKSQRLGFPFYAFKDIKEGEQIMWCYGTAITDRSYPTICGDKVFDDTYHTWARDFVDVTILPKGTTDRPRDHKGRLMTPEDFQAMLAQRMKKYEKQLTRKSMKSKNDDEDEEDEDEDL